MSEQADNKSREARELEIRAALAKEDDEIGRLSAHPDHRDLQNHDCFSAQPMYKAFAVDTAGEDYWWEVSLRTCRICKRRFLHVFLEDDGMPRSGRWYMGRVPMNTVPADIQPRDARRLLSRRDRVYYGGSYWDHPGKWSDQPGSFPDLAE